jgi:hypothetical protein
MKNGPVFGVVARGTRVFDGASPYSGTANWLWYGNFFVLAKVAVAAISHQVSAISRWRSPSRACSDVKEQRR